MMGQRGGSQERLVYSFNLEDQVPSNHLLREPPRILWRFQLLREMVWTPPSRIARHRPST
jgi:hypothetical protein